MATTREEMLEAGVRLYGARSTGLLRSLTAGALAERAGFHRQTFYRHWETQSEYVQDLVRWLLDPGRGPAADGAEVLPRRHDAPADLEAFVHDLARHDLDRVLSEETVRMRFGLLMTEVLREPPFPEILQAYYESTMGRLAAAYDALLGTWGLELLDGVTSRDVARMIQAQLIGPTSEPPSGSQPKSAQTPHEVALKAKGSKKLQVIDYYPFVGKRMSAELTGEGFDIKPLFSQSDQPIVDDAVATWDWEITARDYGKKKLIIKTTVVMINSRGKPEPLKPTTEYREVTVYIGAGGIFDVLKSLPDWLKVVAAILAGVTAVLGAWKSLKVLFGRSRKRGSK